ncbi:MAG TPA: T9SS type A sorting domain-containing protein [Hymenobacter sp.]|uniref:T9SS type A sorting domain-containing protein n=1 Tax=Hymenobacter sp. TaxID=1898978 RepID=UPI002D803CBD|nr:T9SS type A sorting domain-containing protein [Hymenobacter sp.]HET9504680.1 T9SS type A sorting domain-containing protein [Hymenobacter sp.]
MNKLIYSLGAWAFALLLAQPAHAQYATTPPVQDGIPNASEYNNNVYRSFNGGTWYMTWDATNLYIGKTGGTSPEPTIVYLDLNPTLPVTGGSDQLGSLTGVNEVFDRDNNPTVQSNVVPVLPFRADVRVYCTADGEISISRANGTGGWGSEIRTNVFASTPGNGDARREMVLNWGTLTGGGTIPASFNWFGYASNIQNNGANYRYDLAPTNDDASAYANGTSPQFPYYNTVISTANGNATQPFNLLSYTYVAPKSNYQIGDIDVWDFTLNPLNPNIQIGRGTTGKKWTVSGSLVVGSGTLYFGSGAGVYGDTQVGNIRMLGNGVLNMDQTNRALNVRESVYLTGGSQFILSGQPAGDLNVGRDFIVSNGMSTPATFQTNTRAVSFTGTGVTHRITTDNGYEIPFSYLAMNTPSSDLTLNSNIFIINKLIFQQGNLFTGANMVKLDGAAVMENESSTSHLIGNVRITQQLGGGGSGTKYFGNTGLVLTPQNPSSARGILEVTRVTGTTVPRVGGGNNGNSIQRYFILKSSDPSVSGLNLSLLFYYRPDELNNISEQKLALYQSVGGASGSYSALTIPPSANTTSHFISYEYQMPLENNTYLTLSDGVTPLPVKLVAFSAKATANGTAFLTWSTASEKNNKGFSIERQLGANEAWQPVGYVAGANLPAGSVYQFEDKSLATAAASSHAYYRLRQEDFDGTAAYSPVAAVARRAANGSSELVLSPVPATEANLSVAFAEAGQAGLDVVVLNTQGQRMLHFTTKASNEPALSLPVQTLAAGMYIVQVQAPGQPVRHARFVKP